MAVDERAEVPLPTNGDLSRVFHEIGDLLEIKGELVFKTVAYHRAADAIAHSPVEIARAYRAGTPPRIAGVGKAISDKIAELVTTGRLAFLERLHAEVPPTLTDVLAIPGLGPKTVKLLWERLGIATLDDLRAALESGALRDAQGISEKGEQAIRVGLDALERRSVRMTLGDAERIVGSIVELLADTPGLVALTPAGSFRRRRETIGDLDLLAETRDPAALIERFTTLAPVEHVVGAGPHKASVRLLQGPQVDLMTFPPGDAGTYLVHFTGSKEHNVRLRGIARDRGWSLSEKGFLRLGEDGEPAAGAAAELRTFATEAEVYAFLGLAEVPPELREDRGEIEAARDGRLPRPGRGGRPARRLPRPLRLVGRDPLDRADGGGGPLPRLRVPGPDRPLARARDRPRAHPGAGAGAARDRPRPEPALRRPRRTPARPPPPRRPRASASSTAASWRSAPTARSTSTTRCWRLSTWSSRRSTRAVASRGPS